MENAVTIPIQEYESLVRQSEQLRIILNLAFSTDYISKTEIASITNAISKKEEE